LRTFEFKCAEIEHFVTGLRRRILLETANQTAGPTLYWGLILSIAAQCRKNEYVCFADAVELRLLGDLQREVEDSLSRSDVGTDTTSIDVARMYEENPYPRWSGGVANLNPHRLDFVDCYRLDECPAWDRSSPRDVESILVAGCGTGQHPISVGARDNSSRTSGRRCRPARAH